MKGSIRCMVLHSTYCPVKNHVGVVISHLIFVSFIVESVSWYLKGPIYSNLFILECVLLQFLNNGRHLCFRKSCYG